MQNKINPKKSFFAITTTYVYFYTGQSYILGLIYHKSQPSEASQTNKDAPKTTLVQVDALFHASKTEKAEVLCKKVTTVPLH